MRALLATLLAMLAVAATAASRDWTTVVAPGPGGGYVIGNPSAKVKLVEYVSYTCPHCKHFADESAAVLKGEFIRSGSTSLELRNAVHDKLDLAAATLARCIGPAAFPRFHDLLFARQAEWVANGAAYDATASASTSDPPEKKLRALADGAGLSDLARSAGMSNAALDRCFAGRRMIDRVIETARSIPPEVPGTPAFQINGGPVQLVAWSQLEPMLRAAGAK